MRNLLEALNDPLRADPEPPAAPPPVVLEEWFPDPNREDLHSDESGAEQGLFHEIVSSQEVNRDLREYIMEVGPHDLTVWVQFGDLPPTEVDVAQTDDIYLIMWVLCPDQFCVEGVWWGGELIPEGSELGFRI